MSEDMNKTETVVSVKNVSKSFRLPTESSNSLRTVLVNRMKGIKGYKEQKVLKDISFDVEKGDFFGIVGRNGSGKSTLLKIISQIYIPERGTVTINGRLVSFIELGVGFNPELTGKENVYLNGAMLGFSAKEIDSMYDDIVDFAELHEFMNQKLKNYSSGMQVRLAFSVAIQAKSDILVLDEILAVGDEAFQRKSREFFEEIKRDKNKTVILVTHDMGAVQRYCNKVIYVKDGILEKSENLQDITNKYSEDNLETFENQTASSKKDKQDKAKIWIEKHSNYIMSNPNETFDFDICYDVFEEELKSEDNLYIAYSLMDEKRGGIVYDSGSVKMTSNKLEVSLALNNFHNSDFRIIASLRKDPKIVNPNKPNETDMITYTKDGNDARFMLRDQADEHDYALLKKL